MPEVRWGYPRPLLQRPEWTSLNGPWEFAFDYDAVWECPSEVTWEGEIQVPFAPETPASGIGFTGYFCACWYRRKVEIPDHEGRIILHFGAIDFQASIWVNGGLAATHEGGYTPISVDITRLAPAGTVATLAIRAKDDPGDLAKPRGKQEWQLEPHSIWYPRTSGIWQTVWYEVVSHSSIGYL